MGLYKRAHLRGMAYALHQHGVVSFPNLKLAMEVADTVADDLTDEEVAPETEEDGLTEDEAAIAIDKLVDVANVLADKVGHVVDPNFHKVANITSLEDAASTLAFNLIEKVAAEGPIIPGQQPPQAELDATNEALVDAMDNPSSQVIVPKGNSAMDATPGTVGHQEVRVNQPGAIDSSPPETVADVKISALLNKLGMGAATLATPDPKGDGSPGSLGGKGDGRKDLLTNLGMGKNMIVAQGDTQQTPPAVPVPLRATPGTGSVVQKGKPANELQDDVKQAAAVLMQTPNGRQILNKLAEEQAALEAEQNVAAGILQQALGRTANSIL